MGPGRNDLAYTFYDGIFGPMGLCELLELRPDHPDADRWRNAVDLIARQKCSMAGRNGWGLIPHYWYSQDPGGGRAAGSAFYRYFYLFQGITVGVNLDAMASAFFLLRAHKLTGEKSFREVALRQIDWIFGCNPFDASTVEAVGRNQPERLINTDEFFPPVPQIPGARISGGKLAGVKIH